MNRDRTDWTKTVIRYGLALLLSGAALGIRLGFSSIVGRHMPFFLFWLAATIALWKLGTGPAIFASLVGAIAGDYFFMEPKYTLFDRPIEIAFVLEYLLVCGVTCALGGSMRRANARLRAAAANTIEQKKRVEKEVADRKRSEALLRIIIDSAPVGIWMLNEEGYIAATNAASDRFWGMSRPHGLYHINRCKGWATNTGQLLAASDWPGSRALAQGQAVLDQEIEIETLDGEHKYALVSAVPLRDASGNVAEAITVFVDITRRKHAEAELQQQRARIALLHEAAEQLLSISAPDHQMQQIYEKVGKFFGADVFLEYSTDETLINRELVISGGIPDDAEHRLKNLQFAEAVCRCIPEKGEPVRAYHVQTSDDPVLQMIKTLGVRAYYCHPLLIGGRLLGTLAFASRSKDEFDRSDEDVFQTLARYVSIARDRWRLNSSLQAYAHDLEHAVQERTAKLEESSTRLRSIVDTAADAIVTFDDLGRLETANPSTERMFGYTVAEMVGKDVKFLLAEPSSSRCRGNFEQYVVTGKGTILGKTHELVGLRKNRTIFPLQLTISEGRLPNRRFFTGILRDITERKKAEQRLQERNYELEQLSYSIIHDLRAPLRSMRSFGQMLQEDCAHLLDPTSMDYLLRIIDSAQRMDQLITDVFNFSTSMREGFELSRLNPKPLLTEMIKSYPEFSPDRADIHIADNFPDLLANRAGLTQCFSNLLNNAVKFAKPGQKPVIRIWSEEHDGMIRLWFEDEGIGIDARHHERIFEMFQKLDITSRGTGIGLALISKAVEKMEGHVGVESEPGHGSRFWIDLRAANVPQRAQLQPA